MSLPLFVHTAPVPSDSVSVLLAVGDYKIRTDIKDTILNLSIDNRILESVSDGQIVSVQSKSPARASIISSGKEAHISLYLDDCPRNSPNTA